MKTTQILIAGFGGQGILFAGKFLAYKGLTEDLQVSWLPSYGPEMRGGTANCSVIISETPVGSPIITTPDVLVAMNLPSLQKFVDTVAPGGTIILDSTLIDMKVEREERKVRHSHKTPKTHMKYVYTPTLDPDVSYRITTASRYERAEIVIEASDEFASMLRAYSLEAKEMAHIAEEDY